MPHGRKRPVIRPVVGPGRDEGCRAACARNTVDPFRDDSRTGGHGGKSVRGLSPARLPQCHLCLRVPRWHVSDVERSLTRLHTIPLVADWQSPSLSRVGSGDRPMSPQDDVNRRAKLATGFTEAQQNFALDSERLQTESRRVAKKPQRAGFVLQAQKKTARNCSAPSSECHDAVGGQPSALTRAASRDIFRDAVFLWKTPLVTPRISSG